MQLAVGPVAIVSLLTGQLVANNCPSNAYNTSLKNYDPTCAVDAAAQAAFNVGIVLVSMSFLNLGNFISFLSKPVISGFTSGAALSIGLSQVKDAFGFIWTNSNGNFPQQGSPGYDYNYEIMTWYVENWNGKYGGYTDPQGWKTVGNKPASPPNPSYSKAYTANMYYQNPFAVVICWSTYIVLIFFHILKMYIAAPAERKKTWWYFAFTSIINILPLIAIIVGANVAWQIKTQGRWVNSEEDKIYAQALKIVGTIPSGIDIIRIPSFQIDFGAYFAACIPLTLVLYMESYAVGRKIAAKRNELHILNASQEMWANGVANLLGTVSSAYPVSGSFSRSSLNYLSGARTPLSKATTLISVLVALSTLTESFYYIPRASLSAVILVAVTNLISIEDIWEAWTNSKKDFIVLITTLTITFVFDTAIGLALGIILSLVFYLFDNVVNEIYKPDLTAYPTSNNGVAVVKIFSDVNFLTSPRIKDYISAITVREIAIPDTMSSRSDYWFYAVSSTLDKLLIPDVVKSPFAKDQLPLAIVIDLELCRSIDITGLTVLKEIGVEARLKHVKVLYININEKLVASLIKFGITNDITNKFVDLEPYLRKSYLPLNPRSNRLPENPHGGGAHEIETFYNNDPKTNREHSTLLASPNHDSDV